MGIIGKFIGKIVDSFDTSQNGFSARKLSAFAGVGAAYYLSIKLGTPDNANILVGIWLVFVLLCLGIVTADKLMRFFLESKGQVVTTLAQTDTATQSTTVISKTEVKAEPKVDSDLAPLNMNPK